MPRTPSHVEIGFSPKGRLIMRSSQVESSSFISLVQRMEPGTAIGKYLFSEPEIDPLISYRTVNSARFHLSRKKGDYSFDFGINRGLYLIVSAQELDYRFYNSSLGAQTTLEERVDIVLKNTAGIEEQPCNDPSDIYQRRFLVFVMSNNKRDWIQKFTRSKAILYVSKKKKTKERHE